MYVLRPIFMNERGSGAFKLRMLSVIIMGACVSGQSFAETKNHKDIASDEGAIPVITVFGEKIERSIFDTGSSVAVFDEVSLDSTASTSEVNDLLELIPNIVNSGGNNLPAIRGVDGSGPSIGGLAAFGGSTPRLNFSVDGRSLGYTEAAFGPLSLWDMQQVEVYLGPQSYVQGRNASAGAIVLKSNDPTYDFESHVKSSVGQGDFSQTAAVISAPIVADQLAFRLSVDQQKRNSYADLTSYERVGDPNRIEVTTARGKFLLEPSALPGLKTTLTIAHTDTLGPQSESEQGSDKRAIYKTKSTSGIWDVSYVISDRFVFENNLIYTDLSNDRFSDPDAFRGKKDVASEGKEFQIEPIVRFNSANGEISSLVGVRYFKLDSDDTYEESASSTPMKGKNRSLSGFAEMTYAVTKNVDVVAAGRFEREKKQRYINSTSYALDYDETSNVFLPKLEVAYKPDQAKTIGIRAAKGFSSGGAGLGFNGINFVGFTPYEYDNEYVWNYELFTRHRLVDDTLELTSNVFYNDFEDYQVLQTATNGDVKVDNVDEAKSYGAELGIRWMATSNLDIFASLGLLKTDFDAPSGENKELPRAPSLTTNLGALYTFYENVELSGNVNYMGDYYSDVENTENEKIDGYWVANAQLTYVFDNGSVSLFASNLFDSNEETYNFRGDITKQAPRQIGASVELYY